MKHAPRIREEVLSGIIQTLERLRIRIGMYQPDELDVIGRLERQRYKDGKLLEGNPQFEIAERATAFLMAELGDAPTEVKVPRYGKNHRAAARRTRRDSRNAKIAASLQEAKHDPA